MPEGTLVRATIPYPLIWDNDDLDIRVEDKDFKVHFKRRFRPEGDAPVLGGGGGGIISAPGQELPYDRSGLIAYTELEIVFPTHVPYNDIGERDELQRCVLAVINRLLEVYRYATGESYISSIPRIELQIGSVSRALKEDGTVEEQNRERMIGFEAGPDPLLEGARRWLTTARTEPVTEEAREYLQVGDDLPLPTMLYLNAEREYIFESYRIAVVEAETAFEALVDQVVDNYYKSMNRSSRDIENILRQDIVNLLRDHIPQCCGGEQFEGTPEHCAWRNDLYKLRKGVVHDGEPVNAVQAEKALEAADKAMKWIETRAP